MIKKIAFASVLFAGLFGGQSSFGQCPTTTPEDFDFWFGVPVWATGYKTPQKIHLTGAGSSSNCYVIDMPADPTFAPISGTLASGVSQTIDMTSFISQIETAPANAVLNRGLRVRVWGEMVGYYADEAGNNYGSIPWKGPNALGTSFIVPGQNIYAQAPANYPGSTSEFVITATEDNTVVTITPSEAIVGHGANVPFTITLNKGQSYQAANTIFNGVHLGGSTITSNNLVAVTYIDDLLRNVGAADNGGDQLVPISKLGTDYVDIRTNLSTPETIFLTGTQDGTTITVFDGTTTTTLVVNKGQMVKYILPVGKNAAYIHSDNPIMAYQVGGSTTELGSAVLTPVKPCNGSSLVSFQYPVSATTTYFNAVVPAGAESGFLVNGNAGVLTAADFVNVPGYPGWKYCRKNVTGVFTPGATITITNTLGKFSFYQNIFSNAGGGGDFSNFSDFGDISTFPKSVHTCGTDSVRLDSRALAYNATISSYAWTGPNGFNSMAEQPLLPTVNAGNAGWYKVTVNAANGCSYTDSVYVNAPITDVIATPYPLVACAGSSIILSSSAAGGAVADSIRWTGPNGFTSTSANFTINSATSAEAGAYICTYYDKYGCAVSDTVTVTVNSGSSVPNFTIGTNPVMLSCATPSVTLSATNYVQGLQYKTFANYKAPSLYASSDFDSVVTGFYNQMPTATGTTGQMNLAGLSGVTAATKNIGVQYSGYLNITTAGAYTFFLNSYDGSNLYIDGSLVISNDGTHALTELSSAVLNLTAGYHSIEVDYFKGPDAGSAALGVSYQGPSITKTAIPATALFMPGGAAPAGLTYTWYNVATGAQAGTGPTLNVTTPGHYRLLGSNGCESYADVEVGQAGAFDYSDLTAPWPSAQAGIKGCPSVSGVPSAPDAVWAGAGIGTEPAPAAGVNTDTYDDGLSNANPVLLGGVPAPMSIALNSNTPGKTVYYGMWIDWNNDGDFTNDVDPSGAYAFYNGSSVVTTAGVPSIQNVMVTPPLTGSSNNYKVRLIVSDQPIEFAGYDNIYSNGEVEDFDHPVPLPVKMDNFTAEKTSEGTVLLGWDVHAEINADHYEIEWSANQSVFETVAITPAIGAPRHYQTIHHTPLQGNNYYRLKMVDHDKFTEYSDVRVVTLSKGAESFSVSPNPINSGEQTRLAFNLNQPRTVTIHLYNQLGQAVYSKEYNAIAGSNTVLLSIPENLSAGVYFLSVQDAKGGWSLPKQKIVLNR